MNMSNSPAAQNRPYFFRSLRFKAVFFMAFMVVGVALISGLYFSWHARKLVFNSALERVNTVGETFAFNAEYGLLLKDQRILAKLGKGVALQQSILSALVFDSSGHVVSAEPQDLDPKSLQMVQRLFPQFAKLSAPIKQEVGKLGEGFLLTYPVYTQSKKNSEELGLFENEANVPKEIIGYTAILFSPVKIYSKINEIQIGILLLLSIFSLVIIIFVYFITNIFVEQLRRLLEAMKKIMSGDLSSRINVRSRDELGEVCSGFNQMSEALEKTTVSRDSLVKEIEERKRLEHMVLQSEKMSAIGQLAGGVAHEINNPLGVILGFSQNVVKRIKPGDPLEMPLKSIEREAIRCKNLVQDLLTFSRVSKTEKEPVDLKEAIDGALSLVLAQSKVKNVELVKELSEVPGIVGNKNQIQQIVVNLSNNAIDAMPSGGKLTIRLRKSKMEEQDCVEIQVQDTGQGIPADIQTKIFNPFFTTKEIGKGTGLGLSLVYEIVGKHNGKISLDSEVGKGTTFHVFFPLK